MITIFNMPVNITKFPDGTHQVWKLSDELMKKISEQQGHSGPTAPVEIEIQWDYSSDEEFLSVCQLADLIMECVDNVYLTLYCPFLPYGRQDKDITNNTCFGLHTFVYLVNCFFDKIKTVDIHNPSFFNDEFKTITLENISAEPNIQKIIDQNEYNVILYPDKGASGRYTQLSAKEIVVADKIRNQLTGEIEGIEIAHPNLLTGQKVLVVDDICDGGRTFIELAVVAKKYMPASLSLWTTHGIYSKGTDCLYKAGYSNLHNFFQLNKNKI